MPLSADERKRVIQAQALMQRGEYERARQLLKGIDQRETQSLLTQLNDKDIRDRYRFSDLSPQKSSNYHNLPNEHNVIINNIIATEEPGSSISIPAIIIILNIGLWIIGATIIAAAMGFNPLAAFLVISFLAMFYLVIQYLAWRFFWWFLAIGWTLATIVMLLIVAGLSVNPSLLAFPR